MDELNKYQTEISDIKLIIEEKIINKIKEIQQHKQEENYQQLKTQFLKKINEDKNINFTKINKILDTMIDNIYKIYLNNKYNIILKEHLLTIIENINPEEDMYINKEKYKLKKKEFDRILLNMSKIFYNKQKNEYIKLIIKYMEENKKIFSQLYTFDTIDKDFYLQQLPRQSIRKFKQLLQLQTHKQIMSHLKTTLI